MNFAERLKLYMEKHKISQYKLNKLTGVGQSTISQILSGIQSPTDDTIQKLLKGLNISYADFYSGDNAVREIIEHAHGMNLSDKEKMALELYEKMPPNRQRKELAEAIEKLKNLPAKDQEAILTIIDSLSR